MFWFGNAAAGHFIHAGYNAINGSALIFHDQKQCPAYDALSDHLESLSTSVPEILTAGRLNDQCSGLYG